MDEELYEKLLTKLEVTKIRTTDIIELALDALSMVDEKHCNTFIKVLSEVIDDKYNKRRHEE